MQLSPTTNITRSLNTSNLTPYSQIFPFLNWKLQTLVIQQRTMKLTNESIIMILSAQLKAMNNVQYHNNDHKLLVIALKEGILTLKCGQDTFIFTSNDNI